MPSKFKKKTGASKQQVHSLAERLSIPWDDDPKFKRWTKKLTGKSCLDAMGKGELSVVYAALKKRGKEKTAEQKVKVNREALKNATKKALTKAPKKEHIKAWPRHAALNLGQAKRFLKEKNIPVTAENIAYAMLPPTHHTKKEMAGMMRASHKDYYRWGANPDPNAPDPGKLKKTADRTFTDKNKTYDVEKLWKSKRKVRKISPDKLLSTTGKTWGHGDKKYGWKDVLANPEKYPNEMKRINEADLSYPIVVRKGIVVDGIHRLVKAKQTGQSVRAINLSGKEMRHAKVLRKTAAKTTVKEHSRKGRSGRLTKVKAHQREYAKGLPDKRYFARIPKVSRPETWEYVVQEHLAHRAGKHFDLRLAKDKKAHSWVIRRLPKPGEKVLAIHQPTHTREYMDWEGVIPKGYGAGKVSKFGRGQVEVVEANENKVIFNKYDGKKANEYILIRTDAKNWLLMNRTTTEGKYEYPRHKDKYKSARFSDSLVYQEGIMQPKVDGAHALVVLQPGRRPRVFSYRTSKKGDVLEYTHKIPGLFAEKVPYGTKAAVLRAEVFMTDKRGRALPAERTAAVLNSGIERARELQKGTGGLKILPFDVATSKEIRGWAGKDISYERRLDIVKGLSSSMPFLLTPDLAIDEKSKRRMMEKVRSGKHPLTSEGVVTWSKEGPIKSKITDDADVYVHSVFEGEGKYKGKAAGGFYYSKTPGGPIAGKVGSGLSDAQRKQLWDNRDSMTDRVAVLKYNKKTSKGALFAPRFISWHVDKNMGASEIKKTANVKKTLELLKKGILPQTKADKALLAAAWGTPMFGVVPTAHAVIGAKNILKKPVVKRVPSFWGEKEWTAESAKLLKTGSAAFDKRKKFIDHLTGQLETEGSTAYGQHRRIAVKKSKFNLKTLKRMGFKTSFTGIPEPGQSKFRTWRGPKGLHVHDHGSHWVMHRDAYDPRRGSPKKLWAHVKKEGLPAHKYYKKWVAARKGTVLEALKKPIEAVKAIPEKIKMARRKDDIKIGPAPLVGGGLGFLGSIGKSRPLTGKGTQFKDFNSFTKSLKPGDILLTGQATGQNAPTTPKFWISVGTGTPTATHTAVVEKVLGDGRIQTIDFTADGYRRIIYDKTAIDPREGRPQILTALRPKDKQVAANALSNYQRKTQAFHALEAELIGKGVPKRQARQMISATFTGGTRGGAVAFRELFLPYFKDNKVKIQAQQSQHAEALKVLEQSVPETADRMSRRWASGESVKSISRSEIPRCLGGMCSTSIAASGYPTAGKSSVPYFATPADALRSAEGMTSVGRFNPVNPGINKIINPMLRYSPNISRAVLGGALIAAPMAAGIYGYKKLRKSMAAKKLEAEMPKIANRKPLTKEQRTKRERSISRYRRSIAGGLGVGATAGVATGLKDYHMKKDYYETLTEKIKEPLSKSEKKVLDQAKKIPYFGKKLLKAWKPGTAADAIPSWSKFAPQIRAGSLKAARGVGIITALGGAGTLYALDKMKEKEERKKKSKTASQQNANYTATRLNTGPLTFSSEYVEGIEDANKKTSYQITQSTDRGKMIPARRRSRIYLKDRPSKAGNLKIPVNQPIQEGAAFGLVAKSTSKAKVKSASKSTTKIQEIIAAKEAKNQALLEKITVQ